MSINGKGSKRRKENFSLIQKNWIEIDWKNTQNNRDFLKKKNEIEQNNEK